MTYREELIELRASMEPGQKIQGFDILRKLNEKYHILKPGTIIDAEECKELIDMELEVIDE